MAISNKLFPFLLVLLLILSGCQAKQQQSTSGKVAKLLARVNGVSLSADDLSFQKQEGHATQPKYGDKTIDDIIDQELLYQQGIKLGLDKDPTYLNKLVKYQNQPPAAVRQEMARRVFNTQIASKIDVSFKDTKDYFDKNIDKIATELHLEMISFAEREQAEEALKKLRNGSSFDVVAQAGMGKTKVDNLRPWDLGYLKWDKIPVDFVEAVYKLKPGEISDILGNHRTGFQVVKLDAIRNSPKIKYNDVSAMVMNRLRDLKLLEAYNQYVAQLRNNANIVKY